jgi:Flp pilus assembly protein TadD
MFLGRSQLLEGKQKEAFANLGKAAHLSKDGVPQLVLAYAYAATGQREKAEGF